MNFAFYNERRPVTGRSVLWWVVSFFAVIFIANFAFVYFALTSWTGLSTENAYEKGVRYNEVIDEAEAQKKLGWRSQVTLGGGNLVVRLSDKTGKSLTGLSVRVNLIRPVEEGHDFTLTLTETNAGNYQAPVKFTRLGRWHAEVLVDRKYRMRHEVQAK